MRCQSSALVIFAAAAVFVGGCSLVVDFDRSLLADAGIDGGSDAGLDPAFDNAELAAHEVDAGTQ